MFLYHKELLLPDLFNLLFVKNMDIYNYDTRTKSHIRVNYGRTNFSHSILIYQGAKLWNELPQSVRDSVSLNSLKRKLKYFY